MNPPSKAEALAVLFLLPFACYLFLRVNILLINVFIQKRPGKGGSDVKGS